MTVSSKRRFTDRRGERSQQVTISIRCLGIGLGLLAILYVYFMIAASEGLTGRSKNADGNPIVKFGSSVVNTAFSDKKTGGANTQIKQSNVVPKIVNQVTNDMKSTNNKANNAITIGFASTVTGCGEEPFTEGAAVLRHAVHRASIHGTLGGRYDYKMYIIYHPNATECTLPLANLGFELLERSTPVNVSDIQGDFLRERIVRNGCCGKIVL